MWPPECPMEETVSHSVVGHWSLCHWSFAPRPLRQRRRARASWPRPAAGGRLSRRQVRRATLSPMPCRATTPSPARRRARPPRTALRQRRRPPARRGEPLMPEVSGSRKAGNRPEAQRRTELPGRPACLAGAARRGEGVRRPSGRTGKRSRGSPVKGLADFRLLAREAESRASHTACQTRAAAALDLAGRLLRYCQDMRYEFTRPVLQTGPPWWGWPQNRLFRSHRGKSFPRRVPCRTMSWGGCSRRHGERGAHHAAPPLEAAETGSNRWRDNRGSSDSCILCQFPAPAADAASARRSLGGFAPKPPGFIAFQARAAVKTRERLRTPGRCPRPQGGKSRGRFVRRGPGGLVPQKYAGVG